MIRQGSSQAWQIGVLQGIVGIYLEAVFAVLL
jgi:hypothetical protein